MRQSGLTLIELLLVMAILIALSSIAYSVYILAKERAREAECMNNLRQIYLIVKMVEQDEGKMPETTWELFGIHPNHPIRKQYPNRKFYTGPWWRYAKTCFVCPTVKAGEVWEVWFSCDDPHTIPPGTYHFPNLFWGHQVKKGRVRRIPEAPPPNATLACCGLIGIPTGRRLSHNLGVDFSGRVGRCYVPPEIIKAYDDLSFGRRIDYPIGWELVQ